jgi:hypothetical protein
MDTISRFQSLLYDLFQFEASDLDFGIYRILNYKRDQIDKFIKGDKRKYLFILGEKEGVDIAVVWRKVDDNWDENDFRKDKEFIIKELKAWMPQRIYINGQSILTTNLEEHPVEIHYIEPEFKTLMFS